ncbi:hypothetical protein [Metapseudomonas resinovorans]|uniref:Uncharacterized protein n=1 Tax=Metapseudomonas resinovorans NBRC 106553 TaxID=1245471 RepID=S6AV61_METRE|nr:hypothetical protein [Pseudomonas resinovorans]BAN48321.1 hypothetical protein PCA10_25890 [Pseudomonas resinovorans NBRC 106553]
MESKEQHLVRLLSLTTRSLTHLTAAMSEMSFEMMRSEDPAVKSAGGRMIDHLAAIGAGLDQHWEALAVYSDQPIDHDGSGALVELELNELPQES